MTDRERLIELLDKTFNEQFYKRRLLNAEITADYLLANGIVVLSAKPMPVMSDGNPFNSDVYCPFCGVNLSGCCGDEPTSTIQCYGCGEFLDNRKSITREEAENALAERQDSK